MRWKFWEKEKVVFAPEPLIGSFLFATELNELGIMSVERTNHSTEVVFRDEMGLFKTNNYYLYKITHVQHEDFIAKLSKEIKCIITPGV